MTNWLAKNMLQWCTVRSRARRRSPSFFFFQAEDGIRDLTVTGVQTCALPIFTIGIDGACTEAAKHRDERCPRHLRPLLPLWFGVSVGRRTAQVKTPYAPAAEIGRASCRERV